LSEKLVKTVKQLGKKHPVLEAKNIEITTSKSTLMLQELLKLVVEQQVNQFVSSSKGRLKDSKGKEPESKKYTGGTIFYDHASAFMYVVPQVSLGANETIRAKHSFERDAKTCGVSVEHYRGDNGVYKSDEFKKDLLLRGQTIDYAGVGTHHQSGVAERAIRTVSESARAMMLHAAIHWPTEFSVELWPFAVDYAVYLWNQQTRLD
jgi:hypothetical protein